MPVSTMELVRLEELHNEFKALGVKVMAVAGGVYADEAQYHHGHWIRDIMQL